MGDGLHLRCAVRRRIIRIPTVVDAFSRLSPVIGVRRRYTGGDVVATLEKAVYEHGVPRSIRVDNGPEFISGALDLWAYSRGVVLDLSRPGKPTDSAFIEAFNDEIRAECIDQNGFLSLVDARSKCEGYRHDYDTERPHDSIGDLTPLEYLRSLGATRLPTRRRDHFLTKAGPEKGSGS